jgi:hypothetical protein
MGRSGFASVSPQFPRSDVQVYQPCRYGTIPQKADIPEGIGANSKVDAMYYPVKYERPNLGLGHSSCRSIRCCSIQSSTAASHCNPRGRMVTKYYITLFLLSATTVYRAVFCSTSEEAARNEPNLWIGTANGGTSEGTTEGPDRRKHQLCIRGRG